MNIKDLTDLKYTLEQFLDAGWNYSDVLNTMTDICYEKAEHVQINWQDEQLANQWEAIAKLSDSLVDFKTAQLIDRKIDEAYYHYWYAF